MSYIVTASWAEQATTSSYISSASQFIKDFVPSNTVSSSAQLSNGGGTSFGAANNVTFGQITASAMLLGNLIVNTISASVEYVTGSNRFGSSLINTHEFTGSVTITGSLVVNGPTTIQNLTGSIFGTSSVSNVSLYVDYSNVGNKPTLFSSSAQVDYNQIQNTPTISATASYVEFANVANKPTLFSASAQVDFGTISGKPTLFSSSTQVDYNNIQNKPTTIATASYISTASYAISSLTASYALNAGDNTSPNTVSSSAQLSNGGGVSFNSSNNVTFGSVTASAFLGTSSWSSRSITSSYALDGGSVIISDTPPTGRTGSLWWNSSDGQLKVYFNTTWVDASSMMDLVTASYVDYSNIANKPTLFSSSAQVDYNQIQNTPTISATASYVEFDDVANKPTLVSSSKQFTNLDDVTFRQITASIMNLGTLVVTTITSSVEYASGSNIFGSTLSNTHQFTGSVSITGSLVVNGKTTIQNLTGSLFGTASYVLFDNVGNKPTLFSSSAQVDYNNIQNKPTISDTASYVDYSNIANKPSLFSSSAQVDYNNIQNKPTTIATASYVLTAQTASYVKNAQTASYVESALTASYIENARTASYVSTAQTASYVTFANVAGKPSLFSSSVQVDYNNIQNQPTTIATASYVTFANVSGKPTIVSSSAQLSNDGGLAFTSTSNVTFGQITASLMKLNTLIVNTVSSSLEYASGSNRFGSLLTNTHEFTGSVSITGSFSVNGGLLASNLTGSLFGTSSYALEGGTVVISDTAPVGRTGSLWWNSSDGQLKVYFNTTWVDASSMMDIISASYVDYNNIANKPSLVSSSAQIDYNNIQNKPTTIATASYVTFANVAGKPTLFSSSAQVDYNDIQNKPVISATASYVEFSNVANKPTLFSSSLQVDYNNIQNKPTTIATASYVETARTASYVTYDNVAGKPSLASSSAQLSNGGGLAFNSGNSVTFGQITASVMNLGTLIVTTISSSLEYASGSNRFGSLLTNTHEFTGSVRITGSLFVNGPITGSLFGTASYVTFDNVGNKPTLFSSSLQVDYNNIQNKPTISDTASYVDYSNIANKPSLFSSSLQVDYNNIQNKPTTIATASYVTFANVANKPSGLVSSSAQIDYNNIQNQPTTIATASYVTFANVANKPAGLVSSSAQIDYNSIQNQPTTIATASYVETARTASYVTFANVANKPAGLVSSSAQVDYNSIQNKPTTIATASYVTFDSVAGKPTLFSSSTQVDYNNIQNKPTTIATASYVTFDNVANKPTLASSSAQFANGGGLAFGNTSDVTFRQITASVMNLGTLIVTTISSSVQYASGSNRFGSLLTNTHEFTGSVSITGSFSVNGGLLASNLTGSLFGTSSYALDGGSVVISDTAPTGRTGSLWWNTNDGQLKVYYNTTWVDASTTMDVVTASYVTYENIANKPTLFSSSAQVDYTSIQNKPTTIETASYVLFSNVKSRPSLISSSAQLSNGGGVAFTSSNNVTFGEVTASFISMSGSLNGLHISRGATGSANSIVISAGGGLRNVTTGFSNIAVGTDACRDLTTAESNVAIGQNALLSTLGGSLNVAIGSAALQNSTNPNKNIAIGRGANQLGTGNVSDNISIGDSANYGTRGTSNVAIGTDANAEAGPNSYCTAIGTRALRRNSSGSYNVAIGYENSKENRLGNFNTIVGVNSFTSNVTGSSNTVCGYGSLGNNISGLQNTVLGANNCNLVTSGSYNTVIGRGVDVLTAGESYNIVIADGNGTVRMRVSASGHTTFDQPVTASAFFGTSSWSVNAVTSSVANSVTFANVSGKPTLFSSSAQVDFGTMSGKPTLVSSSVQLSNGGGVAFTSSNHVTFGEVTASSATVAGVITSANITINNTDAYRWNSSSRIYAPSDGIIRLSNSTNTDFTRLQFGGTSSSFPSIKKSGTEIHIRLADDTGWGGFSAGTTQISGSFGVSGSARVFGNTQMTGSLDVSGSFTALAKSFLINHPTKPGMKLQYGVTEGPEHSVFVRGRATGSLIELPEYWTNLVDENTITVQLTPIGFYQELVVKNIENNKVYISNESVSILNGINCFYYIMAERKDIPPLVTEY